MYIYSLDFGAYLRRCILIRLESIFMHDPISLLSIRCSSFVEHKGFPHSNKLVLVMNCLVSPSCLPKPGHRSSVCSCSGRILLILMTKEVPFTLLLIPYPTTLFKRSQQYQMKRKKLNYLAKECIVCEP